MQKAIPMKTHNIQSIHLEITGRCNLQCQYCYNVQFNREDRFADEMSTETVKKLITEAKALGCRRFTFSGGEPFLRPDFFEILAFCGDAKADILTNSKLLRDPAVIERLQAIPQVNEIKISLDGFVAHDKIRVGSSHQDVIDVIQKLKEHGFNVVVNTEVTALSLPELYPLYEKLKSLFVDRWRVDLPFILGRYREHYEDFRLPDFMDFIREVKRILLDYLREKPSFELELFNIFKSELTPVNAIEFDYDTHPCAYRKGSFPMRPNGDMIFCPSMDVPMSNYVIEGSLAATIDKKFTHPFYDLRIRDFGTCMSCRYLNLCNTGCRVDALYYLGDYGAVDPICCNLMPLIEQEIIPILPEELRQFYKILISPELNAPTHFDIDALAKSRNE